MARAPGDRIIPAYIMVRIMGKRERQAETIRKAMISAKISMLEEILAHPYSPHYLHCSRNFIDYATPIEKALSIIRQFPNAPRNPKNS